MKNMKKIIDFMTGDGKYFEQAYLKLYGKRDYSDEIKVLKHDVLKKYICVAAAILALLAVLFAYERLMYQAGPQISGENEITFERPLEGEGALKIPMKLEADLGTEERLTEKVMIMVRPEEIEGDSVAETREEDEAGKIATEIRQLVKMINRSSAGKSVVLPANLSGGGALKWETAYSSNVPLMFLLLPVVFFVIYQSRYSRLKRMENDAKESIIRELPDFMNRLILLLNAGLVLTGAFDRILMSCERDGKEVKSYFYSQLSQIRRSMNETNSPMISEFKDFAGRSGVREFMRVANIMSDNVDKGTGLVEKLMNESELLWLTKKKRAEERGRLAETKLTLPLVMLLLSLIMVTIAPALMEM